MKILFCVILFGLGLLLGVWLGTARTEPGEYSAQPQERGPSQPSAARGGDFSYRREMEQEIQSLRDANQGFAQELAMARSELAKYQPVATEERFADGSLRASGATVAGRREGVWQAFHPNGQKASEGAYVQGLKSGRWRYWLENGEVESHGEYLNDKRQGDWWIRDVDGVTGLVVFDRGAVKDQ